jgi:hypothetical protein
MCRAMLDFGVGVYVLWSVHQIVPLRVLYMRFVSLITSALAEIRFVSLSLGDCSHV